MDHTYNSSLNHCRNPNDVPFFDRCHFNMNFRWTFAELFPNERRALNKSKVLWWSTKWPRNWQWMILKKSVGTFKTSRTSIFCSELYWNYPSKSDWKHSLDSQFFIVSTPLSNEEKIHRIVLGLNPDPRKFFLILWGPISKIVCYFSFDDYSQLFKISVC